MMLYILSLRYANQVTVGYEVLIYEDDELTSTRGCQCVGLQNARYYLHKCFFYS